MNTVSIVSPNWEMLIATLSGIALTAGKALVIFIICRIAMNILLKAVDRILEKSKVDKGIGGFTRSAIKIGLWALTIIIVAGSLGIETASLVAVLSVASLALSLSVQNILTDVFSGITILMSQPFKVGQYVEIAGVSGTVTAISIMRTTLETVDNKQILIPNSEITATKITNFTSNDLRRVDLFFSASYDNSTDQVKGALMEAILADERILVDPAPFVAINAYKDNSIEYLTRTWCATADYWDVYFSLNERVRECFAAHGVAFSYPHVVVHTEK